VAHTAGGAKDSLRTLILGVTALVLGAFALHAGVQFLQAVADRPSAIYGLGSALDDAGPLHLLPVRVTGLIQEVIGRPVGPLESAVVLACILFEAVVVGVVFQLALAGRSFGLVLNSLLALAGAWGVMLLYDLSPGAEGVDELDALVARGLVASVAAPAALILVKAFAVADADTFLSGGDTRAGDAMRGLVARFEQLASAAARRRPKGPSAERIRGAVDRRKS
jgi:hypothetical protein